MKTTLSVSDFRDAFAQMDRKNQFTYDALDLIYDWIEDNDSDYELDVIGLCCELSEDTPKALAEHYSIDVSDCLYDEEVFETVLEYLRDETTVLGILENRNIVYVQF
jgi:hypothetical protein